MAVLKLPKLLDQKPSEVTVTLTAEPKRALAQYVRLYRASYGEDVPIADLIPAIVSEFLASEGALASAPVPPAGPETAMAPVDDTKRVGCF